MKIDEKLNDLRYTFVIAEAGSNWKAGSYYEDLERAKKLIMIASQSGAEAVKFQTFRSESVYVTNAGVVNYLKNKPKIKSINEIFENLSMPYEMIPELAGFCEKREDNVYVYTIFSL